MQVAYGAPVIGADGQEVGHVDALVVDAGTKRARGILIGGGHFGGRQRLVEISELSRADDQGIYLSESRAEANAEAETLDSEEVALGQRVAPPTEFIPAAGVGGPVYADAPPATGQYPDNSSFFVMAPIDPPPVEIESNLSETDVVLKRGSSVMSRDHHKLGEATAFELGDMGRVDGVTVAEGFIFKHTAAFPLADIEEFDDAAVHLRLTRADAEAR
jgi:hypothetical protein